MGTDGTPEADVAESGGEEFSQPRALIHKKILDTAQSNPTASSAEIASDVSGASVELVESVLDEYGDPVSEDETQGSASEATESPSESTTPASGESVEDEDDLEQIDNLSVLNEKQRATLRAIYDQPTATQSDIADALDVSRATVPKRLNKIPGFEWSTRQEFVERLFESERESNGSDGSVVEALDELTERVEALEAQVEAEPASENSVPVDADLLHKVVHATIDAEYISRDEELRLLKQLLPDSAER